LWIDELSIADCGMMGCRLSIVDCRLTACRSTETPIGDPNFGNPNRQSAIHNPQLSPINNPQSTILNPQSLNPQSTQSAINSIRNPQSTIRN
jgi:hypothetical protein